MGNEKYENLQRFHQAVSGLNYFLEVFGDTLAERQGYKNTGGMEAIHIYLIAKHSWLPKEVIAMSPEHLRLALHEEMQGWTAPAEARLPRER